MIYAQQTGMFPRIAPSQVSAFPMQATAMPAVYAQEETTGFDTTQLISLMMTMMIMVMMMKMMTKATENI